ncbi:MAG: hypothetical protein K0U24_01320 [Gammaproteobacteria bacterium]|nr:hypothetical protein [Gammaproteobacteria bacterium]
MGIKSKVGEDDDSSSDFLDSDLGQAQGFASEIIPQAMQQAIEEKAGYYKGERPVKPLANISKQLEAATQEATQALARDLGVILREPAVSVVPSSIFGWSMPSVFSSNNQAAAGEEHVLPMPPSS